MDLNKALEWIATVILIIGTGVNSAGYYPLGPAILIVGGGVWLVVSIRLKWMSLIVVNIVMTLTAIAGIVYRYWLTGFTF